MTEKKVSIAEMNSTMTMNRMNLNTPYVVNTKTGVVKANPRHAATGKSQFFIRKGWQAYAKYTFEDLKNKRSIRDFVNENGVDEDIARGISQYEMAIKETESLKAEIARLEKLKTPKKVAIKRKKVAPIKEAVVKSQPVKANSALKEAAKDESNS